MENINIERTRWVLTCKDREGHTKIFCGLARNYHLTRIDELGDTAVKTYLSKSKALSAFKSSYGDPEKWGVEAVEIKETISNEVKTSDSIDDYEKMLGNPDTPSEEVIKTTLKFANAYPNIAALIGRASKFRAMHEDPISPYLQ